MNYFVFNQLPPNMKDENKELLNSWKNELIEMYKPDKINFLDYLPISHEIMEMSINGQYIFPEHDPLYTKLTEIVDNVTNEINKMKQAKLKENST